MIYTVCTHLAGNFSKIKENKLGTSVTSFKDLL